MASSIARFIRLIPSWKRIHFQHKFYVLQFLRKEEEDDDEEKKQTNNNNFAPYKTL